MDTTEKPLLVGNSPCDIVLNELRKNGNRGVEIFISAPVDSGFLLIPNAHMDNWLYYAKGIDSTEPTKVNSSCPSPLPLPQVGTWATWKPEITIAGVQLARHSVMNVRTGQATPMILFGKLANVLAHDRRAVYEPCDGTVYAWYGGVLLYGDAPGMSELIKRVCAEHPEIAARQLEIDMCTRVSLGIVESANGDGPRRSRMRV